METLPGIEGADPSAETPDTSWGNLLCTRGTARHCTG